MYIRGFSKAIPKWKVTAKEIADWTTGDENFISKKIGIEDRHFLSQDETVTSLASQAVENLLAKYEELKKESIDLLVLVTQNPDFRLPHGSALIQSKIGLTNSCACFDISLGCSGWVYSLSVVKGMMASEGLRNAVIVTCDPYSRIMNRKDKSTVSVFGDAAAATWLSAENGAKIGRANFGTDGSLGENLTVKGGGSANSSMSLFDEAPKAFSADDICLQMNGRAILEFMMSRVPTSVQACLNHNGLKIEDVDHFVFHQASAFMLQQLRRQMNLTPEKVHINVTHLGNTVSSTIPIALEELQGSYDLSGKKVLVSGFGVGLSWATNILFF